MTDRHAPDQPPPPTPARDGESEAYFRTVFESAAIGMGLVDPNGHWLRVNQSFCQIVGRTEAELRDLTFPDITHPDDLATSLAHMRRLLAGEIHSYALEKRYLHRDGRVIWAQLSVSLVRADDGAPLHLIAQIQDITRRKQTEAALRASEARYERSAANAPGLVYQLLQRPDGSVAFPFVSEGARGIMGLTPEEIQRNPAATIDLIHPEDRPAYDATVAAAAATLAPWRWEGRVVLPTGEEKWLQWSSRPERQPDGSILWDGLLIDITARRWAAKRLAASEQRLRSLVDHNIDAVMSVDLEGRLVTANPACETMFGCHAGEMLGQSFARLVAPEHLETTLQHFHRAVHGTPQTYESAGVHKSGRRIEVLASNVPIIVDGQVVGVFGVIKDVTEQRSLQAQLRQAQKMEAVGRLAGGIAHDFNNLLTAILMHSEFLLRDLAEGPGRQDAEVIRQTAERAAGLTRQLLAFSRNQVIQPRLVDLNAVVKETQSMLRRTLDDRIMLEPDLGDIGSVLADPGQLEQVLVNLAVNACDAMPEGGTLTLRTRNVIVDKAFARRNRGLRPGAYVTLAVEDTGVGIPPELQARIFEPFFTTKPMGEGTGLGLATVYGIVKQWGGYTAVESVPGVGTTFTIYLPRRGGTPQPEAREPAGQLPAGTETVLVVEDEAAVRTSIQRILARQGYTVIEARHGADALRVLDEAAGRIDLVLTDLVMPEMGGRELIAEFRARSAGSRILVMSGYDQEAAMRGEALPAGTPFLEKPFTVEGLLRGVRAALDAETRSPLQ
jgi:PAS domain S-box-containing protein